ncbi:hypothetical protein SK128_007836 [Halocaridina rubra]|uniref:Uncharacterized protein n=1 Tax=Halocaridina rubra TaxID=373956 RepID=A0AAN8XF14_HALRR
MERTEEMLSLLVTGCNNCGEGDEGIGGANDIIGDGQCGLLMLDGNLGREIWRSPLRECPIDMQCDLLDVSGDHLPDCIVRGSYSMMFMIETRYGSIIWHLHQHQEAEAIHKTRPPATVLNPGPAILLPDINNDTYGDLLFWGSLSYQSSPSWNSEYTDSELWSSESDTPSSGNSQPLINNLILVCGQSGNILGKPLVLKQCQKLLSLALEGQLVTYICQELNGEVNRMSPIPLISLLHQILGSSVPVEKSLPYDNGLSYSPVVHGKRSNSCVVSVYYNKRPCPICQSRVILSSDNVIHWNRTYEHSSVVSWASLLSNNECHGAILKIWEYKHTATVVKTAKPPSLGSKRSIRTTQATEEENLETAAADVENDGLDLNFGTSMNSSSGESKKMSALFHKKNIVNMFEDPSDENGDPVSSKSSDSNYENKRTRRKQQKEGIDNSPDLYEHPTIHRHKGKLASGTHDEPNHISESYVNKFESVPDKWPTHRKYPLHPKQVLSTSASIPSTFPSGARTMPPDVLAPPGYQLQHIHEQISVLKFNGSVWYEDTLTSIGITQLCRDQTNCIPDTKSHCKSVAVNPGLNERTWQLVTTSTTFVNSPSSGEEHHSAPWTLTSIVRKIILTV